MSEIEEAAEMIEKGADLIRINGHHQNAYWPGEHGYVPGQPCCILGSLRVQEVHIPMIAARAIMKRIGDCPIPWWNDQPGRTVEEVVEVMLQAAKDIRNGEV